MRTQRREGARTLKYTLCFCREGDAVLMLLRRKWPHAGHWNGLGGKIEPGESPRACVEREVAEEAGLDLRRAASVRFGGVVTWPADDPIAGAGAGMYVYVAGFGAGAARWAGERAIPDGVLRWQPVDWACDPANAAVVANIPRFLPPMLAGEAPREYACAFAGAVLLSVTPRPLAHLTDEGDPRQGAE